MKLDTDFNIYSILVYMKKNLNSKNFKEDQMHRDIDKLNSILDSLIPTKEIDVFRKLITRVQLTKIDKPTKFIIINGAILFLEDFLDEVARTDLSIKDQKIKTLYLEMLEAAYPEFTDKIFQKDDINAERLDEIKKYLECCDQIIQKFDNKEGYDSFKENCQKILADAGEDSLKNINECFQFISKISLKTPTVLKEESENVNNSNQIIKYLSFSAVSLIASSIVISALLPDLKNSNDSRIEPTKEIKF